MGQALSDIDQNDYPANDAAVQLNANYLVCCNRPYTLTIDSTLIPEVWCGPVRPGCG